MDILVWAHVHAPQSSLRVLSQPSGALPACWLGGSAQGWLFFICLSTASCAFRGRFKYFPSYWRFDSLSHCLLSGKCSTNPSFPFITVTSLGPWAYAMCLFVFLTSILQEGTKRPSSSAWIYISLGGPCVSWWRLYKKITDT